MNKYTIQYINYEGKERFSEIYAGDETSAEEIFWTNDKYSDGGACWKFINITI